MYKNADQPSLFDSTMLRVPTSSVATDGLNGANTNSNVNKVAFQDRSFHDWYRFVLSFPPHLVRQYIQDFGLQSGSTVLDPFSGTGTTILEAKLNHLQGIGIEANPFACFAGSVKVNWDIDPAGLRLAAKRISERTLSALNEQGILDNEPFHKSNPTSLRGIAPEAMKLLIQDSISPLPLHKTLVLLDEIREYGESQYQDHLTLALGSALVTSIGNLKFGPEVGLGRIKEDVPVIANWRALIDRMADDLLAVQGNPFPDSKTILGDAREIQDLLDPHSIDAVITSPPYPNEKDYTRTTRLESVLLGFYDNTEDLRRFKKTLLRSNTRGVYKDDEDHLWVSNNEAIQMIAQEIEQRRIDLGKTSGFERMYSRLTLLYFGGMAKHLSQLCTVLRPGAYLAYVVGDQASYFRILIRTGELLSQIAVELGYELVRIDLFRTRFATATQDELREEVLILRWPG